MSGSSMLACALLSQAPLCMRSGFLLTSLPPHLPTCFQLSTEPCISQRTHEGVSTQHPLMDFHGAWAERVMQDTECELVHVFHSPCRKLWGRVGL